MKILKNRIYNQLEENQEKEQAGFRKGFRTVDHIHTLNQVIEKAKEYQIEQHLDFVDFCKAFDMVNHNYLWEALHQQGVEQKVIRILANIYSNAIAYVRLDQNGTEFKLGKEIKQEDALCPNLFNAVMEKIFKELEWDNYGLKIDGERLNNLKFADDIVLISDNRKDLQNMVSSLVYTVTKNDNTEKVSRNATMSL